jgi:tRNA U55 pseudouridine synthase TruB
MGKKSSLKKIRKLAEQMPEIMTKKEQLKGIVKGSDLLAKGVKEVQGNPVKELGVYKEKEFIKVPINHNRKMKQLYNKYGPAGVRAYANEVNRFIATQAIQEQKTP